MNACKRVRESGCYNFEGCRIELPSPWNLDLFEELLTGYHDEDLIKFLKFGWPIEVENLTKNRSRPPNQKGACTNLAKLKAYVEEEIANGAVIGPFLDNPFGDAARFSPLDAIPKKDSEELRIIMNLSYPDNSTSVNAAIDKDSYLGKGTGLSYPGVDDLVRLVKRKGRGCLLFKCDLRKCYR